MFVGGEADKKEEQKEEWVFAILSLLLDKVTATLIPYRIVRKNSALSCDDIMDSVSRMMALIKKFRLGFHHVEVLPDIYQSPRPGKYGCQGLKDV